MSRILDFGDHAMGYLLWRNQAIIAAVDAERETFWREYAVVYRRRIRGSSAAMDLWDKWTLRWEEHLEGKPEGWRAMGEARGRVTVPRSRDIACSVEPPAMTGDGWLGSVYDLSPLKTLEPDALADLRLNSLAYDDNIGAITALSGLQTLSLSVGNITDAGLASVRVLRNLRTLDLSITAFVTDAGIAHLSKLAALEDLDLSYTKMGDDALRHLRRSRALRRLNVEYTRVSNTGLTHLCGLPLGELRLAATTIDDDAVPLLRRIATLRYLDLTGTRVTEDGLRNLRRALPTCIVECN